MNISTDSSEYIITPARLDDVPGIFSLLKYYSDKDVLLPRSQSDIYKSLREFQVVRKDQQIIACGALLIYTKELAEIRSLAVHEDHIKAGLGYRLVKTLEEEAIHLGLKKIMALTYVVGFFRRLGFDIVEMKVLPEKVWGACINCHKFQNCDEIAVLKYINQKDTQ